MCCGENGVMWRVQFDVESGVMWRVLCVVKSVASCGECGVMHMWRVWCVVESVLCCGEWCVVEKMVRCGGCSVMWRVLCMSWRIWCVQCCGEKVEGKQKVIGLMVLYTKAHTTPHTPTHTPTPTHTHTHTHTRLHPQCPAAAAPLSVAMVAMMLSQAEANSLASQWWIELFQVYQLYTARFFYYTQFGKYVIMYWT